MAKPTRKSFLADIERIGEQLRAEIEARVSGFPIGEEASAARRDQARASLRYFARTYFPHYFDSDIGDSAFQSWAWERLHRLVWRTAAPGQGARRARRAGKKIALAAPRGESKTTIGQVAMCYCVVHGLRHFIPVIADAFEQAATILEGVRVELDANPRLLRDYPEQTGQGRVWKAGVIVTRNNIKLQAFGSGKRMRGLRHGPHRPDLVWLDDLENDENVGTPAQRNKLESWLRKTVLQLGPPDDSLDVFYVGTVLHYDAVLARTLRNPLWESRTFRSIVRWPDRMDLWERWEEVYINEGQDAAADYYEAHRAELEQGAEVSWPDMRPLVILMEIRARDGHAAFDSEHQQDPVSGEDRTFAAITYWVAPTREWVFFGALDPSLGKHSNRGDPSAILVGGWDRRAGVLDVVEADIRRRVPDRIVQDVIAFQRQYRCLAWSVEAVQFQELLRNILIQRSLEAGVPVPARAVVPIADKDLRIESLQPYTASGRIRFARAHTTLLSQLAHWPKADHDDGPDALQMLWALASTRGARAGGGGGQSGGYESLGGRRR